MSETTISGDYDNLCTLNDLRTFVHQTLCGKEALLAEQFPLTEMALTRRTRFCGLQFSLQGPRDVRLGAIWAADHNVVYFYDARGERYLKIKLNRRIMLETLPTQLDAA